MKTLALCLSVLWLAACAGSRRTADAPLRPAEGTVSVDGGTLSYEVAGEGPPLVLIHGGFGDRRMWVDQFEPFARRFRVVRYDHRGFGGSSAPQSAYDPVDDLMRLMDHLGIERAHVVGNSMGGSLALDFTLLHPDRVTSLTIVAAGPTGYPTTQADRERFTPDLERIRAVFGAASAGDVARAAEMWFAHPMVAVASQDPSTAPLLRTMIDDNSGFFTMEHWPEAQLDPPAVQRLGEVRVPTLVIVGDRDTAFVRASAAVAAEGIPGARQVVLEGADHLPQMVAPEAFNRALLDFLQGR